ncbi:MAG TPA: hypothetical protein VFI31_18700 [Pirellulales bacterium]|nr:hypothetical protein [Pirellulales bacterium]
MRRQILEPSFWPVPEWHHDFGDAQAELEHLRAFASALLAAMPEARVDLDAPEPGLMYLAVETPHGTLAEVYSIESSTSPRQRRYGLFFAPGTPNEREVYQEALVDAVTCFTDAASEQ